ncbi:hypothetical protein [Natrinema sp. H-ect4]|uniref:hypothetical protein n=1 Tax=Natrinema sp. H-ect4 TaxID=3242699 RepID=UPI0035A95540
MDDADITGEPCGKEGIADRRRSRMRISPETMFSLRRVLLSRPNLDGVEGQLEAVSGY